MAAFIKGIKDTLDAENAKFSQAELRNPLFLNSVPKGGTHLIRNILRMFVPVDQHYSRDFVQIPNMHMHMQAFDAAKPMLSCGHLLFADVSVRAIGKATRHIVLVRDPYDWVLARTRFHLSDEFQQANLMHLKDGTMGLEELLNLMIVGIHQKSPSVLDIYMHNAVAWTGTAAFMIKFEDLRDAVADLDSKRSAAFFDDLFAAAGLDKPEDWKDRVRTGANPAQSRTARQNLNLAGGYDIPNELPAAQKRLLDVTAPGVRAILGYS